MMPAVVNLAEYRDLGVPTPHIISHTTAGFMDELESMEVTAIFKAFREAPKGDWIYTIRINGKKVFVAENGEGGYTAMLASEY